MKPAAPGAVTIAIPAEVLGNIAAAGSTAVIPVSRASTDDGQVFTNSYV